MSHERPRAWDEGGCPRAHAREVQRLAYRHHPALRNHAAEALHHSPRLGLGEGDFDGIQQDGDFCPGPLDGVA
eukprot:7222145-Lingulodinium_polyedra.AAC.1